jgi:hypothetical protein
MLASSPRLALSIQAMQDFFPGFSLSSEATEQEGEAVWHGRVQPIQSMDQLSELLDDIHCERPVWIRPNGEVCHHPDCACTHVPQDWLNKIKNPFVNFDLEVRYRGGKQHPKVIVCRPAIPPQKARHLFGDGSICPYAPWENIWLGDRDSIVDYMGHAAVWLIKWMVWDQTGIWIGPELSHHADFLIKTIKRNQQCWCGSGLKYKKCHLTMDQLKARSAL